MGCEKQVPFYSTTLLAQMQTLTQLTHPPPFHPHQLRHAQQGCPHCLDHLVRQNEPLVHWVLHRFYTGIIPYDEGLQAGRIGLWKALLRFDLDRGTAFSTYAVVAIRRTIQLEDKRFRRFWRPRPYLPPPTPPDPLDEVQRTILVSAVPAWIDQLSPRLVYVLRAYYGLDGAPSRLQRTIARSLGLTRQRVQQLLQEARLLLALPIYSWEMRRLLDRTSAADVRAALHAYHRFCRKRRSP